jgi:DnaJ-class molecular chaperone
MEASQHADLSRSYYEVLGLDEDATIVRRQIEEAYERRARQLIQRLAKIDASSEEADALRGRVAQLNAAKAVLVPRKLRDEYRQQLHKLREAERELQRESAKGPGGGREGTSAVLLLHLRQQVERTREELTKLHERQCRQHALDHEGGERAGQAEEGAEAESEERRRRTVRLGPRAADLAALAARRPVKRR